MRAVFKNLSFWLGVVLGALTVANLIHRGLSVSLSGFPEQIYAWYKLVFHGAFDLIFGSLGFWPPVFVKDLFSAYVVLGYMVMRALVIAGGITFIDQMAGTDFRMATLERVYNKTLGTISFLPRPKRPTVIAALSAFLVFAAWPIFVIFLWRTWTRDGYSALAYSDQLFAALPREQAIAQNDYIEVLRRIERAADADSEMYLAFMERDAFLLSLSLSFNFVFVAAVAFFTWSELSVSA